MIAEVRVAPTKDQFWILLSMLRVKGKHLQIIGL